MQADFALERVANLFYKPGIVKSSCHVTAVWRDVTSEGGTGFVGATVDVEQPKSGHLHALVKLVGKDNADLGQTTLAVLAPSSRSYDGDAACAIADGKVHPFSANLVLRGELKGVLHGSVRVRWSRAKSRSSSRALLSRPRRGSSQMQSPSSSPSPP